jgi:hypothetical protein
MPLSRKRFRRSRDAPTRVALALARETLAAMLKELLPI